MEGTNGMTLDYATLDALRTQHPAWRLLRSDHAPLVASFLNRVFVAPNVRVMATADLAEALEDELYALRERLGLEVFPKSALDYLNDWADPEKGWLRKFYMQGSDEPRFDLTPATNGMHCQLPCARIELKEILLCRSVNVGCHNRPGAGAVKNQIGLRSLLVINDN